MAANPQDYDLHGTPMAEEDFEQLVSGETSYRYELIDGILYNMTGSTPEHGDITGNIFSLIHAHIRRKGPCKVYQDQYVKIPNAPTVVPDVVVTCDRSDWEKDKRLRPFKIQSPCIVVEVLSPSTEKYNRKEKFARYKRCPSLEVYILAHQDSAHVEVYRRETDWRQEHFSSGQAIRLDQIGLNLLIDDIYEGVL
ncbi:MAG TPA: Uma2 family endonuclease [Ktedonobacteraceae bacterium]|nr:Uma2 family endonuclease [Ktedonobacteraceae bacterium]